MELTDLGLTRTEARVYLALLKEGRCLASAIIHRLQLHRATVYDVLERLTEKGLVCFIVKNKKKEYEAVSPEKFIDILQEEKQALERKEKEVQTLVKGLIKIKEQIPSSEIKILIGKEGLKVLMNSLLDEREFLALGGEVKFIEYLPFYTIHWARERERKKVCARILTSIPTKNRWRYNQYRQLPKNIRFPTATILFKNTTAILLPEEPLKIVMIQSEPTYTAYKAYFELLWAGAKH